MKQGAFPENKINNEFPQIVDKPFDSSSLVQNVEENVDATTSKTISNKTTMEKSPIIIQLKDSTMQKTSPSVTNLAIWLLR